eukprot:120182-Pleurochrysis_carterae.AAC.3
MTVETGGLKLSLPDKVAYLSPNSLDLSWPLSRLDAGHAKFVKHQSVRRWWPCSTHKMISESCDCRAKRS